MRSPWVKSPYEAAMPQANTYNYVIFNDNAGFHAVDRQGNELPGSPQLSAPEKVIQAALDQLFLGGPTEKGPGRIYIQTADPAGYQLSSGFTGFKVSSHTRITMDPTTLLIVPDTYEGEVFHLRSDESTGVSDSIVEGGIIRQNTNKCIGVLLEASSEVVTSEQHKIPGVFFNRFVSMEIRGVNIGVKFHITGKGGWITGNSFQSLRMYDCKVFIDFDYLEDSQHPPYPHPTPGSGAEARFGIHWNHFNDVQGQSTGNTLFGARNIRHIGNTFIDVKIWDIPDSANFSATIHPDATNTLIIGGILTNKFQDRGQFTKIFDQFQGCRFANDTAIPATAMIGTSPPEPLSFFGGTPATQQPRSTSGEVAGNAYGTTERDMLNAVYKAMQAYGLIKRT